LAYKVLKNANCPPPELQLKKEIRQMKNTGLPCGLWERAIMDLTGSNTFMK
jgi:hypothetical protein